jgi:SAM-dependent methyltransferase
MFSESAELYDLVYSSFKDYRAESEKIAALIRRVAPDAHSVLDVGCGTGSHAKILADEFGFEVDGLDLQEDLLEIARSKSPRGRFSVGDMTSFDLGRSYDVVLCLFSSIGYARTTEGVTASLRCFRDHLRPGGCVLVEPWFQPDQWRPGRLDAKTVTNGDVTVVRMSHADARGRLSVVTFDYLVGTVQGIQHRREIHELGLFTELEMLSCFEMAGLPAEFDSVGLMGRGLYVAGHARPTATGV